MLINKKSNLKINDLINFDEAKELSKAPLSNALIQNSFTTKKDAFGDIETYLEILQKWQSKKLITEEEFKAKKKNLLDL